ncbi:histidinol dehydrogenase [Enterovirga rhinocerotis]|uniref:Histidinol dehydrogenase n=1 Tax=Enterovirga rhinocerotis TaxID=1339210 RepID=A0A4V6PZJ0_9HYPH|nr:histidinol dehydrogenase [Enterovirga rhinocerotis]TDR89859.1 histidinol dehydrogenase [Enterovirga rhinocerotis]
MVLRLDAGDPGFEQGFLALLAQKREVSVDVDEAVASIIAGVREQGDAALIDYTARFDGHTVAPAGLAFTADEIDRAVAAVEPEAMAALRLARDRIEAYHRAQVPQDHETTDAAGVRLGWRWNAIDSVGLYVPGGKASYPSSVLMNAVPAKVAGVERVVMVVPTPGGELNPLVLAAARLAGVDEIYRIGGAQAVAALAYGTQTIRPVVKIVGPGNAYVAAAKRRVFGQVGIDMIAGPSEVLILADATANPDWVAADLLAQAEHDEAAQSILITSSPDLAEAVAAAVEAQLATLPRAEIARASWRDHGAIVTVPSLEAALPLSDRIAPEHLEIEAEDAEALAARVRNAGAIFLGSHTPEAVGDYVAGSNHVLPTARSARFSSGLGVLDFMKRISVLRCDPASLAAIGPAAVTLGRVEGLEGHARSVAIRLEASRRADAGA